MSNFKNPLNTPTEKQCIAAVLPKQYIIFDPPIPGYEPRAEIKQTHKGDKVWTDDEVSTVLHDINMKCIVLTPIKRIEDLLPVLRCEVWAAQDEDGMWRGWTRKPVKLADRWHEAKDWMDFTGRATEGKFNPFGLPVEPNENWRDTLYHFQVGQGWRKCEAGK